MGYPGGCKNHFCKHGQLVRSCNNACILRKSLSTGRQLYVQEDVNVQTCSRTIEEGYIVTLYNVSNNWGSVAHLPAHRLSVQPRKALVDLVVECVQKVDAIFRHSFRQRTQLTCLVLASIRKQRVYYQDHSCKEYVQLLLTQRALDS